MNSEINQNNQNKNRKIKHSNFSDKPDLKENISKCILITTNTYINFFLI